MSFFRSAELLQFQSEKSALKFFVKGRPMQHSPSYEVDKPGYLSESLRRQPINALEDEVSVRGCGHRPLLSRFRGAALWCRGGRHSNGCLDNQSIAFPRP